MQFNIRSQKKKGLYPAKYKDKVSRISLNRKKKKLHRKKRKKICKIMNENQILDFSWISNT